LTLYNSVETVNWFEKLATEEGFEFRSLKGQSPKLYRWVIPKCNLTSSWAVRCFSVNTATSNSVLCL